MTRRDDVMTLVGGEAAQRRGKGGDDAIWANANFTGPNNKIYAIDSTATNR
jgi:hypothetical protein